MRVLLIAALCIWCRSVQSAAADAELAIRDDDSLRVVVTSSFAPKHVTLHADVGSTEPALSIEPRIEPIAIALLVSKWTMWVGRDELPRNPSESVYDPGALRPLQRALDEVRFAEIGPAKSQLALVLYGAEVVVSPRVELSRFRSSDLGPQLFHQDVRQRLMPALSVALDSLRAADAPRKALIVFGDGGDPDEDIAPATIANRARDEHVAMFAILWRPPSMGIKYKQHPHDPLEEIIPSAIRTTTTENFAAALRTVIAQFPVRYEIKFDGKTMPWDGEPHRFEIRAGTIVLDSVTATLPNKRAPRNVSSSTTSAWWLWGLGFVAGVLFSLGLVGLRRRIRSRG
jgi:hypothetical protein